tara:strand:- start:529 stop:1194 length:666 start_codon:yes stop_codon:yes gene_type:complete
MGGEYDGTSHDFGKSESGVKTLWDVYNGDYMKVVKRGQEVNDAMDCYGGVLCWAALPCREIMTEKEFTKKAENSEKGEGGVCALVANRKTESVVKKGESILQTFYTLRTAHRKLKERKSASFRNAESFQISCSLPNKDGGAVTKKQKVCKEIVFALIGSRTPDKDGVVKFKQATIAAVTKPSPEEKETVKSFNDALKAHKSACTKVKSGQLSFQHAGNWMA